jgi:hypothetical protein
MISHRLDIALQEAVQAHADHHWNGVLEVEKILSALSQIAASYIAELPKGSPLYSALGDGMARCREQDAGNQRPVEELVLAPNGSQYPSEAGSGPSGAAAPPQFPAIRETSMSEARGFDG